MTESTQLQWLRAFADAAALSDKFAGSDDHSALLASGLFGEAGSVVAEMKKKRRELDAYPAYRERMVEEVGDFLWYFVRLADVVVPGLLDELQLTADFAHQERDTLDVGAHLEFSASVGDVIAVIRTSERSSMAAALGRTWSLLTSVCNDANVSLRHAAERNTAKTKSRWPSERLYAPLFDESFPAEEQLPRHLQIDFVERTRGSQRAVILRCNDINFGDRLTDNIQDPDGYRFHDIFHFAYAVHLGWSPVVRALMRTKRKSDPKIDEAQDGARAVILEEAVSAIVFSRAKQLKYFEELDHVDFDLLKTVKEFVEGFEVAIVPLWQWEEAILDGYRVFRLLCDGPGGRVTLDLGERRLTYAPPAVNDDVRTQSAFPSSGAPT